MSPAARFMVKAMLDEESGYSINLDPDDYRQAMTFFRSRRRVSVEPALTSEGIASPNHLRPGRANAARTIPKSHVRTLVRGISPLRERRHFFSTVTTVSANTSAIVQRE